MPAADAAYQRGVAYLLRNQLDDGTWFVRSRAFGFQRYFETGFPHGSDQFISASATAWAVIALVMDGDFEEQQDHLRYIVAHEVAHALRLRHNFAEGALVTVISYPLLRMLEIGRASAVAY